MTSANVTESDSSSERQMGARARSHAGDSQHLRHNPSIVLLLAALGCGSGRVDTPWHPPPSAAHRDAAITGQVVDRDTRQGVEGATIVVRSSGSNDVEGTSITDESGHFRLTVAGGVHELTVFYGDTREKRDGIDARSGETMHLTFDVPHDEVERASVRDDLQCPPQTSPSTPGPGEADAIVASELERLLHDRESIADGSLVPATGVIPVVLDASGGRALTQLSIPQGAAQIFSIRTRAELRAEADRKGKDLTYLVIDGADIRGDCAIVTVSVEIASPGTGQHYRLCCCSTYDMYERTNGRWVFKARVKTTCA